VTARTANLLGAYALAVDDRVREATGLDPSAAAALVVLLDRPAGLTIDALRRALGLSHSGGVRLVARLADERLARRASAERDGRAVDVHLTAAGRRRAGAVLTARQTVLEALLGALSSREAEAITPLLERLLGAVTEDRQSAVRICRLCDVRVCGHPGGCPVTQAADLVEGRDDA
jgi:MarR family transcriptional repressor of emrRAB